MLVVQMNDWEKGTEKLDKDTPNTDTLVSKVCVFAHDSPELKVEVDHSNDPKPESINFMAVEEHSGV